MRRSSTNVPAIAALFLAALGLVAMITGSYGILLLAIPVGLIWSMNLKHGHR